MTACCLPSLYNLVAETSFKVIIQSIRSALSLHSLRTRNSEHTKNFQTLPGEPHLLMGNETVLAFPSKILLKAKPTSVDIHEMRDLQSSSLEEAQSIE